jgi:hypothetical protein
MLSGETGRFTRSRFVPASLANRRATGSYPETRFWEVKIVILGVGLVMRSRLVGSDRDCSRITG